MQIRIRNTADMEDKGSDIGFDMNMCMDTVMDMDTDMDIDTDTEMDMDRTQTLAWAWTYLE
jgi:hypothetical protein